jgi:hypothetical protein
LGCGHVEGVDVGALFAVDLDRYEVLVEELSDGLVLEGLVGHDVTPVTGRVTNGEEHRAITFGGLVERVLAPRAPRHGIVNVV